VERTVEAELQRLRKEIEECRVSPLAESSPRVVFGEGDPLSPMTIVGEGPGEREEQEGRPFVGRAGQLLDKVMATVGLTRGEIWLTNVLKRRAFEMVEGRVKNRLPRANELAVYKELLDRELRIVSPRLILCLGNLAANVLIHRGFRMTKEHGQWFSGVSGRKLMATFHPAYILRLEGAEFDEIMRQTVDDFTAAATDYRVLREQSPADIHQQPAAGKESRDTQPGGNRGRGYPSSLLGRESKS